MFPRTNLILGMALCLAASGAAVAQGPGPGMGRGMGPDGMSGPPPMVRSFHDQRFGRWWNDPKLAQQLQLTEQQKKQMDKIFLEHRLNLIDLNANLEKQQVLLRPMISADQPNENQVLAQIDKIAQARAELEKANARMLFDIRKTLTAEQWQKLRALHRERMGREWHHHPGMGPGGPPPPPPQDQAPAPAPQP